MWRKRCSSGAMSPESKCWKKNCAKLFQSTILSHALRHPLWEREASASRCVLREKGANILRSLKHSRKPRTPIATRGASLALPKLRRCSNSATQAQCSQHYPSTTASTPHKQNRLFAARGMFCGSVRTAPRRAVQCGFLYAQCVVFPPCYFFRKGVCSRTRRNLLV